MNTSPFPAVFGALADPTRLAIVERLLAEGRALGRRDRRAVRDQQAGDLEASSRPRRCRADRAPRRPPVARLPGPARGNPGPSTTGCSATAPSGTDRSTGSSVVRGVRQGGEGRWLTHGCQRRARLSARTASTTGRSSSSGSSRRPPERVFEAWTDPEILVTWWGPDGFTTPDARSRRPRRAASGGRSCVSARGRGASRSQASIAKSSRRGASS